MIVKAKKDRELILIYAQNTQNENRAETITLDVPEQYESFNKKIVFITDDGTVWDVIQNNQYKITNAITKYKQVDFYIWLTKEVNGESIDFRSKTKTLKFYDNIDASDEITPEEIHGVNTVVNILEEEIEKVENLNIEAEKVGTTTTITITKKDGTTEQTIINDGINGQDGQPGRDGRDGADGQPGEDAKINGRNSIEIEAGQNITIDDTETGIRINSTGGSGGTSNYNELSNKPKINNVELNGNKSLNDLGIQPAGNYALESEIPDVSNFITKSVNDLVNYYKKTETFTKQEVNNLISAITTMDMQVVQTLPTQDISTTTIYLVPKTTAETNNAYDEYIYVSNNWELIGSTEVDLTDYVKNTDYASNSKGGVFKVSSTYGLAMSQNGILYGSGRTYAQYGDAGQNLVIAKGTLENVITGKGLGTYSKPSGGIPSTDLTSTVQTSLSKADTALQSHQDISGKEDKTNKVTALSSSLTDTQYPSAKVVYDNIYTITSDNKFDNIYDETGRLDPSTGGEVNASTFNRTKFRDFGETITGNIYITISETTANYMYICYYDENKVFKKSRMIWENNGPDTYEDYVEGVRYFRISTKNTWTGNVYISYIYGGIDTANYNYEKKIFNIDDVQKPLNGKIVINLGDSIFGKRRPPNDISTYISKLTGATVYNCGFGGTTAGTHYSQYYEPFTLHAIVDSINTGSWTVQDNGITAGGTTIPDYFSETVALLKSIDFSKVDMITIAYGTNDWNFGTNPIDNPNNSKDINSYAGAIRYSIEKILTAYPHIKIFLCTPIYRIMLDSSYVVTGDSDTTLNINNKKLTDFIEKLKEVALEYHLTYIDNYYGLGMNRTNWLYYFKSTDGTHPIITGIHLIAEHMSQVLIGDYTTPSIKVKTETSTTTGEVYDVTYINTMIGDVETILTTLTTGSGV